MSRPLPVRSLARLLEYRNAAGRSQPCRLVALIVRRDRRVVTSVFIADDGGECGPLAMTDGGAIRDILGADIVDAFGAHIDDAFGGESWQGAYSIGDSPDAPKVAKIQILPAFSADGSVEGAQILIEDRSLEYAQRSFANTLKAKMDIILEHVADAIITIDVRGVLQGVNRAAENLFGWDRSEMLGRPVAMLMDPAISTLHQNFVQRYVATGVSGVLNHRPRPLPALHKSGAAFNVEMTIAEADLDGSPVFIGVCRQISASSAN